MRLVALVVLLAGPGCSAGPLRNGPSGATAPTLSADDTANGATSGPVLDSSTSGSAPLTTVAADDLAATTAIVPLDGFTEISTGPGIGPLDLLAAAGGDRREQDALSRFGFRDGHARGFAKDGEELLVSVLRFASAAEAAAYLQDTIESSLVSNGSFLFAVPVTGATGYREQGASGDGDPFVTYGSVFARGDRCFEQLVRSPAAGQERSEADAQVLARRQADRVGG